jgi:hypothetical protein
MRPGASPKKPWGRARLRGVDVAAFVILWPAVSIYVTLWVLSHFHLLRITEVTTVASVSHSSYWSYFLFSGLWLIYCCIPMLVYAVYARLLYEDWVDIMLKATFYLIVVTPLAFAGGIYGLAYFNLLGGI